MSIPNVLLNFNLHFQFLMYPQQMIDQYNIQSCILSISQTKKESSYVFIQESFSTSILSVLKINRFHIFLLLYPFFPTDLTNFSTVYMSAAPTCPLRSLCFLLRLLTSCHCKILRNDLNIAIFIYCRSQICQCICRSNLTLFLFNKLYSHNLYPISAQLCIDYFIAI